MDRNEFFTGVVTVAKVLEIPPNVRMAVDVGRRVEASEGIL